ncbi:4666_t:CDS:2 [Funneliformis geosporum]|uniref:1555_t:CDS:1 n=1 Tax=Funneliformis geosporum TaxID=1117311 RepID=A0A9W4WIQ7_9GLOM|nr:1555_t:CDS:2 [Funneliformis geosporum]CAI2167931.1 4666_t:CDS:2 [Funneliformis geosporum]
MDKFCNKCKKVFGATEPRATTDDGKSYCENCCKCDGCQQTLGTGQHYEKDGKWYCKKCSDDLNTNDKDKCSFCGKEQEEYDQCKCGEKKTIKEIQYNHKPYCSKRPQDKPTDKGDKPPKSDEICERCKISCRFDEKRTGNILNYTFKKERERNCDHCGKREWPDLNKEQAQRLTRVVLFPPQLDISNQEQRLNNQSNLTPEERQQANYLRNLQQNTLQNAENSYKDKYGELKEDSSNNPNKGKGMDKGVIALLIIAGVAIVGVIVYFLIRKKPRVIDSLIGIIRYFQAGSEAEQLKRRVEELEREL